MTDWSATLAKNLAAARVDPFAFPALDLPWNMPLDPQQQGALDDLHAQWCPEFDPPALCEECGWPELECCCDVELLDLDSMFELRERGAPTAVVTQRGWAVKRRPSVVPPWPGDRDRFFGLHSALDAAVSKGKTLIRPGRATQPSAVATELPQARRQTSHLPSSQVN